MDFINGGWFHDLLMQTNIGAQGVSLIQNIITLIGILFAVAGGITMFVTLGFHFLNNIFQKEEDQKVKMSKKIFNTVMSGFACMMIGILFTIILNIGGQFIGHDDLVNPSSAQQILFGFK